ncbi:hypothetical protein So717_42360 [Roseobacter cerasinus]|uniref:O-antigen ligase-related domain-containing protein n=1 Tax=Roseobacter cerasinus TaxID=2602289 RepID=A0A640VWG3_9RHOB|nr:O-antigen ligase family protein [Roseobacter cerasinus]GFE52483.1 hypothetical protein So717_42360 [Roseobacter cerasinus]
MAYAQTTNGETDAASAGRKADRTVLFVLFFICILLPLSISLGSLRLTPLRLFLIASFIPFVLQVVSGKVGRFHTADILVFCFGGWIMLSMIAVHGMERVAYAGITVVELIGGYVAGRVMIQSATQYKRFFNIYFIVLILLAPLVLFELYTARAPILDGLGGLASFGKNRTEFRFGLSRVQVSFSHSILWGLFCSIAIGNLFYIYGKSFVRGSTYAGFALSMTYSSLSSGPFLAGMLQFLMILWDKITKGKWKLLVILFAIFYVTIDLLSNRTPIQIIIEELTFSSHTGWYRIHIWRHGTDNVWDNPIFGLGLNDWKRASWMTGSSVDNFWLLTTMRHGLPAIGFLFGAIGLSVLYTLRAKLTDPDIARMRVGYLVTMAGLFFTLATVHVWEQLAVLVMFYIGMGSWFMTAGGDQPPPSETTPETEAPPSSRYSRRAPKPSRRAQGKHQPAKPGRPARSARRTNPQRRPISE